ncbi:beta-lactamase/transpeptidase-like protein [Crepidotus variabilis]|uniref:Beta-lactamase/transpeptidase-like protein n=1 Tax=Crepidotus variabilis TaxID=179855 RepID=A0A9P6EV84_9AGAR|nr:beta-lactamase/transpeptidase-like protein [Crepidotus variabilis]
MLNGRQGFHRIAQQTAQPFVNETRVHLTTSFNLDIYIEVAHFSSGTNRPSCTQWARSRIMEKGLPEYANLENPSKCRRGRQKSLPRRIVRGVLFSSLTLGALYHLVPERAEFSSKGFRFPWDRPPVCPAPKANLFAFHPPRPSDEVVAKSLENLDNWLTKKVSQSDDIDNIDIAIVTAAGPIFQKGYGVLKANDTEAEDPAPPDANSIYRIASISKMFTVLETLILRERGSLNWDDPIEKYLPDFAPPSYGWSSYLSGTADPKTASRERITLRQAATHLSGIGRDYPPRNLKEWPVLELPSMSEEEDREWLSNRTRSHMMKAISQYPLINKPWMYPIYSNTGIDMLGLSNVAANKLASSHPDKEPQTHKDLLKRDIFDPLGLTGSFYRVPDDQIIRDRIAIPKNASHWADLIMGDADDPAGGQFSSLADLAKVMQTFLSPVARGGVIPAHVVSEWLRPVHVWGATKQQVGAPWEIDEVENVQYFSKGGNLPGYHTEFSLFPEYSYGIIVLMNGQFANTLEIVEAAAKHFQPAIAKLYTSDLERRYVGTWVNGDDVAEISLDRKGKHDETLIIKKLVIGGIDVLQLVQEHGGLMGGSSPVALWSTGRVGEFRLAFGREELNRVSGIGCWPYWLSIDPGVNSRGAPIDLLYWDRGYLTYPSGGVSFERK